MTPFFFFMKNFRQALHRRGPRKRYLDRFLPYDVKPITDLDGWVGLTDENSYRAIKDLLASANREILICLYQLKLKSPLRNSIINNLVSILVSKFQAGCSVKILLNYKSPGDILRGCQVEGYKRLRKEGLEVKLFPHNKLLHSKLVVVDERKIYLGSHNWTVTAFMENFESGIILNSEGIAKFFKSYFEKLWEK